MCYPYGCLCYRHKRGGENDLYSQQSNRRSKYKKAIAKFKKGGDWASHKGAEEMFEILEKRMVRIDNAISKLKN